ncbi:MAG TPA: hypothetical protein VGK10_03395 [Prolixibacteraceae bacterium]|jgi:uncharacterized coiled-coil protein SlyX
METTKKTQLATIIIAGFILLVGIVGGVYVYNQKEAAINSLMAERDHTNLMILQKDSIANDMENTFNEIEANLKFIKEKRSKITMIQSEGGKNRKQLLVEDVKLMDNMLEESEKRIAELEGKLKKSGLNLKSYEKRLQALNENIASQNTEIAELKKTIEDKNVNLAELNTKVETMDVDMKKQADSITYKQQVIVERTNKLNTAHVAMGTFKELKAEGILDREGGVLGLGSTKEIQENFDSQHFTDLDIRNTKTIPVNAKKAVLISEHPVSSYSLVEENGQIAYLEIKDPQEFWRISKYAVIQVK